MVETTSLSGEHNLKTLLNVLNRYLTPDPATGLVPMTPMHVEIDKIKMELQKAPDERTIKLWLVNTEDLPLILRVQAILGKYRKGIIGE